MQKKQAIIVLIVIAILAGLSAALFYQKNGENALSALTCSFLRVGKADAMVVECKGLTMVIDTGEEDDGQELVEFLKKKNISFVDVLIITHYDRDHVGGADTLVREIPVARVLMPDYENGSTEYMDFIRAMEDASIQPERIRETVSFPLGDALVSVDPPESYEIPDGALEYDNNFSLLTTVTHGTNRLLFAGDIEKQRIRKLLDEGRLRDCSFLKVPHHGIYNTASEEFIKAVKPKYAVICSSDKNPAEAATLELLKKYGVDVLETRHGRIALISDGKNLELHQKIK